MQAEESVEVDGRARAAFRQSESTAQSLVIGIAMRRHRGKTIESAAQDHDDEAPVVGQCSISKPRRDARQRKCAARHARFEEQSPRQHGITSAGIRDWRTAAPDLAPDLLRGKSRYAFAT